MDAIPINGAATSPTKNTYITKSPRVIVPARIARPPTRIIRTPIAPTISAANAPSPDTPVIVVAMFRNRRCAPRANTSRSPRSDRYALTIRIPPNVSARRPVTSALILPRSRNRGRSLVNAYAIPPPNVPRTRIAIAVSCQFSQNSTPSAMLAVTRPPTSCTRPVPTRFRIPSASLMIREIRTPVLVESK